MIEYGLGAVTVSLPAVGYLRIVVQADETSAEAMDTLASLCSSADDACPHDGVEVGVDKRSEGKSEIRAHASMYASRAVERASIARHRAQIL